MKFTKNIIAFAIIAGYASIHCAFAQNKVLSASYICEYRIPESIKNIENEWIRERALSALKEKSGIYNLYVKGDIYAFTSSVKESKKNDISIEGDLSSYIDIRSGKILAKKQIADKRFLVEDIYNKPSWTILSEKKTIAGKLCTKAILKDGKEVAWFCPEIPSQGGPLGKTGLPGLVFALETDALVAQIQSVEFIDSKSINIQEPEGKKISAKEFEDLRKKKMEELGIPSSNLNTGGIKVFSTRKER